MLNHLLALTAAVLFALGGPLPLAAGPAGATVEVVTPVIDSGPFLTSDAGTLMRSVTSRLGHGTAAEDYGAAGDGATDDEAAIERALAASPVVRLTPGKTYVVRRHIDLNAGNVLIMYGATVLNKGRGAAILANNVDGVAVLGGTVTSDKSGAFQRGLSFTSCTRVLVKDVYVHTFNEHGIFLGNMGGSNIVTHTVVENIDADGNATGVAIFAGFEGSGSALILANIIRNTNSGGIALDGGTTGGPGVAPVRHVIAQNLISNTGRSAITLTGSADALVTENHLTNIGSFTGTAANAIALFRDPNSLARASTRRTTITGNLIATVTANAIALAEGAEDTSITGNLISNPHTLAGNKYGIDVADATRGVVAGNYVRSLDADLFSGVLLQGATTGFAVHGNFASGVGVDGRSVVRDIAGSTTNTIGANYHEGYGTYPNATLGYCDHATTTHTASSAETALKVRSLRADVLGLNGRVTTRAIGTITGTAGTKTLRLYLGDTGPTVLSTAAAGDFIIESEMANAGATNAQRWDWKVYFGTAIALDYTTSAIGTSAAVDTKITVQLTDGSDSVAIHKYCIDVAR